MLMLTNRCRGATLFYHPAAGLPCSSFASARTELVLMSLLLLLLLLSLYCCWYVSCSCSHTQAPEDPPPLLSAALKCALASERGTRHGQTLGTFLADTLSPLPVSAALLQYSLPPTYGTLPLMARLAAGWVEQKQGVAVALLTVQYHIPREFQLAAKGEALATGMAADAAWLWPSLLCCHFIIMLNTKLLKLKANGFDDLT